MDLVCISKLCKKVRRRRYWSCLSDLPLTFASSQWWSPVLPLDQDWVARIRLHLCKVQCEDWVSFLQGSGVWVASSASQLDEIWNWSFHVSLLWIWSSLACDCRSIWILLVISKTSWGAHAEILFHCLEIKITSCSGCRWYDIYCYWATSFEQWIQSSKCFLWVFQHWLWESQKETTRSSLQEVSSIVDRILTLSLAELLPKKQKRWKFVKNWNQLMQPWKS